MGKPETGKTRKIEEFRCHQCGNCCKGDGIVNMQEEDIRIAARILKISTEEFLMRFTTETEWGERWLIDQTVDEERWCIFLRRNAQNEYRCRIQHGKPVQCRDFPFKWRSKDAFKWCEGLKN